MCKDMPYMARRYVEEVVVRDVLHGDHDKDKV